MAAGTAEGAVDSHTQQHSAAGRRSFSAGWYIGGRRCPHDNGIKTRRSGVLDATRLPLMADKCLRPGAAVKQQTTLSCMQPQKSHFLTASSCSQHQHPTTVEPAGVTLSLCQHICRIWAVPLSSPFVREAQSAAPRAIERI